MRIKFIAREKPAEATSSNIEQPLDFLKIFFIDELIKQIIIETNNYYCITKKLKRRKLSFQFGKHNIIKEEFFHIIIIRNMRTMPLINIQEYW